MRARATLPRQERLRRRSEFEQLYRGGARLELSGVTLYWRAGRGRCRMGVSASRRLGTSVERNRARRWLREAYRHNKGFLPAGAEVLLVAQRRLFAQAFCQTLNEVATGFRRVRAWASPGIGEEGRGRSRG